MSFVFLGTMIMLNLFIGVILNSMEEVQRTSEQEREALGQRADKPASTAAALALIAQRLDHIGERLDSLHKQIGPR